MAKQQPRVHVWLMLAVLLGTAVYAIAEDLTLVTYYPSPRGVYNELRARGNVQIGSITAPADPATAPRLHVVGGADTTQVLIAANATQSNTNPLLRALASNGTTELFRLHSDDTFNLFLGSNAGQSNTVTGVFTQGLFNTFVGSGAGFSNTRGEENTAAGSLALSSNTTGWRNTAVGFRALESNTTGGANTAMGRRALRANTTGGANTATGENTLRANTTGGANTATGASALEFNTTGDGNTATGMRALSINTTGRFNTATGDAALASNTTGGANTATGSAALARNTTGANNIAMGFGAGDNVTVGSNNIVIGFDIDAPSAAGSNQLTIGNLIFGTGVDGTGTTLSTGGVGIGTTTPTAKLHVVQEGPAPALWVDDTAGDTTPFIVTAVGSVGIGTTAPLNTLHVHSAGGVAPRLRFTNPVTGAGGADGAWLGQGGPGGPGLLPDFVLWNLENAPLRFGTNNTPRMIITGGGFVGIGTTNPLARLQVRTGGATVAGAFQNTTPGGTALTVQGRVLVNGDMSVIDGTFTATDKRFTINHPIDPQRKLLIHGTLEGPESAVFYRGESALTNGTATLALPAYFEALTRPEGRTVMVTPKGLTPFAVSATEVQDGRFSVYGTKADGAFYWEVKAVRADVPPLDVEVDKTTSDQ
ncbi:MAG: hypothetical protein A3I71_06165 [Omnitrophica WOR_2 bacterium RIFCSPLOWO2_02_FULL_63_16]|nr:MAG: hypothetical protein A2Z92_00655 [Omnitrophica WOR_2 bacterium GWA2_63_20]OGX30983.1 MAG: hypothetical protein A3E56_01715 [Omnitrophica WOR_2 bacterium RIFCSPHIGHO2_12_FULL_64_13]OGX36574.1 MAG: hypothetical protein A3B73_05280 [Omnitrophica WOR_2 bacterium RIFCSPHIGHO2_02_FULL_63_39]OGX46002.1 MAG: hypothetical protein A3I71_06165 [Omnitrophica WOR_2 bacterium RIFCSPLOWO2_02_FULL_63_16]